MARVYQEHVVSVSTTLTAIDCGECGVIFGLEAEYLQCRRNDGKTFWCPNGHGRAYVENEADRLRKKLAEVSGNLKWYKERTERLREDNMDLANKVRGQKAAKSRIVNRLKAGLCPFCRRNFEALGRHMRDVHPGKIAEETKID